MIPFIRDCAVAAGCVMIWAEILGAPDAVGDAGITVTAVGLLIAQMAGYRYRRPPQDDREPMEWEREV